MELRLSHSKTSRAQKCLYDYKLHYLQNVRVKSRPSYFAFGTAFHECIRRHVQGLPITTKNEHGEENAIHLVDKVYAEELDFSRMDAQLMNKINIEKAKLKGIVDGYIKHYAEEDSVFDKFVTEREETIPVPVPSEWLKGTPFNKVTYLGFIDWLGHKKNGWWIKETKTTGDNIDDFIEQARWNAQLSGYMVLAKSLIGEWPRGVIFDVVVKSSIKQRTSKKPETIEAFQRRCYKLYAEEGAEKRLFMREEILFNARDVRVWKRELLYQAEDILQAHRRNRYPMNQSSCKGKYGLCDKFNLCSTGKMNKMLYEIKK